MRRIIHVVPEWEADLHTMQGPCFCWPRFDCGGALVIHESRSDRAPPEVDGWAVVWISEQDPA